MKRILATFAAVALMVPILIGLSSTHASAATVPSISCGTGKTYGWVISPINGLKVGAKYCRPMTVLTIRDGMAAFWFTAVNGVWIPTSNNVPNAGGSTTAARAHAKAAKDLGAKYGLHVSFTKYTGNRDSMGWVNRTNGVGLAGTYYTSPMYPGKGLIEISNGGNSLSAADGLLGKTAARTRILNTVRHEISHARIELKCGTTRPPIVGDRNEEVTDAYAATFFGKTLKSYDYNRNDVAIAKKIAAVDMKKPVAERTGCIK